MNKFFAGELMERGVRTVRLATVSLLLLLAVQLLMTTPGTAQRTTKSRQFQAEIEADGSYRLTVLATGWALQGSLPGGLGRVRATTGTDQIGAYRALSATFQNRTRMAQIRIYDTVPVALFRDTWVTAGRNTAAFPAFQSLPSGLMRFSYRRVNFGFYEFGKLGLDGPWSLFDKRNHVLLLSPADHFQISSMQELPAGGADSAIASVIESLPAGFSHSTLLVAGSGMNHVFTVWGRTLLALSGKNPPANNADVTLAKLGYWTDNVTTYYYKFDPKLGYAGTLLAVRDEFRKLGIPLGYMQLDSWFYPKGPQGRWNASGSTLPFGEYVYRADKSLFPHGLAAFHARLGMPVVTHARWVAPASPYRTEFKMSGNVVVDSRFWSSTADYLHRAGVATYEQDWLDHNAQTARNLHDPSAFLGEMSRSMRADGLTIQYCMPLPSDYMASTLYPTVQTIRTSGDGFERARWDTFLYDSRLASAVGLWPWTDAFFSKDLGSLIISTLSAGPVGVGDAISDTNAINLTAAVRKDGTIIKPDTSLLPIDAMYVSDAMDEQSPMVATATTNFGDFRVQYVFAYPRRPLDTSVAVPLKELGIAGPVFAYNWAAHQGRLVRRDGSLCMQFKNGWAYWVLSPLSPQGIALSGETGKIVPMGKQRIAAVTERNATVASIRFAVEETRLTISGYATHRPVVTAVSGKTENLAYDPRTRIFRVEVLPGRNHAARIRIAARGAGGDVSVR